MHRPARSGGDGYPPAQPDLARRQDRADKPELLVYERRNDGSMKLVALEYLIFQSLSHGRPSLFGTPFDEIPANNRYGIPASWALHAWIWKPNPSGCSTPGTHGSTAAPASGREPRLTPGQTVGGLRQRHAPQAAACSVVPARGWRRQRPRRRTASQAPAIARPATRRSRARPAGAGGGSPASRPAGGSRPAFG